MGLFRGPGHDLQAASQGAGRGELLGSRGVMKVDRENLPRCQSLLKVPDGHCAAAAWLPNQVKTLICARVNHDATSLTIVFAALEHRNPPLPRRQSASLELSNNRAFADH